MKPTQNKIGIISYKINNLSTPTKNIYSSMHAPATTHSIRLLNHPLPPKNWSEKDIRISPKGNKSFSRKDLIINFSNQTIPSPFNRASTSCVPNSMPPMTSSASPQTWYFSFSTRELSNTNAKIQLTAIESLIVNTLVLSKERIISKQELVLGIRKDPQVYSGLEMSLSRLQNKFRKNFDERLFRSVRNRGYCLVQEVKLINKTDIG